MMENILTQGVSVPRLGFGTFRMSGGVCQSIEESALALGFRRIDTAKMYENEAALGAPERLAVRSSSFYAGLGCDCALGWSSIAGPENALSTHRVVGPCSRPWRLDPQADLATRHHRECL
jgi:hypothetical protein